jgi:hypothetical protein
MTSIVFLLLESCFQNRYHAFPPMNYHFADAMALSRAVLSFTTLSLVLSCSSPKNTAPPDATVFNLSEAERRSRFPQSQNIGVVELSGARVKARPYSRAKDEKEFLATGGALLVKKVDPPILASAPEILVTPDAAILSGRQAMVRDGDRLLLAEGDETEFVIDGVAVKISGPYLTRNVKTGKTALIASAPATKVASASKPAKKQPQVSKPVVTAPKPPLETPRPVPAPPVVKAKPKPAARPAPVPVAAPVPAPTVDRKELLNLMREPTE